MSNLPDPEVQPEFYNNVPAKRLLAWIVDVVVITLISLLTLPLTAFLGVFVFPAIYMIVGFIYRVALLGTQSATLGMKFVSCEFRRHDGSPFDMPTALLHTTGYAFCITLYLLQVVSIFMIATDARARGLVDRMLGTVVLNARD